MAQGIKIEGIKIESKKSGLWQDAKFLWLIASVALVAVFEFLSLMGEGQTAARPRCLPVFCRADSG